MKKIKDEVKAAEYEEIEEDRFFHCVSEHLDSQGLDLSNMDRIKEKDSKEPESSCISKIEYDSVEDGFGNASVNILAESPDEGGICDEKKLVAEISRIANTTEEGHFLESVDNMLKNSGYEQEETEEAIEEDKEGDEFLVDLGGINLEEENLVSVVTEATDTTEASSIVEEESEDSPQKKKKLSSKERKILEHEEYIRQVEALREKRRVELLTDENSARKREQKTKRNNAFLNAVMLVSTCVFLICAVELGSYFVTSLKYRNEMKALTENMGSGIGADDYNPYADMTQDNGDLIVFPDENEYDVIASVPKLDETISDEWAEQYEWLVGENSDTFGWVKIPDTEVNYPVMFTPYDYDKYINTNFSGEPEYRGTPFMDEATKIGQSQNYIIYGHNMKDDLIFGSLDNYLSKSYYEEHKYIYFNTAISEGVYEVMAVVKSKIYKVTDTCFKYYKYGGILTEKQFNLYVKEMRALSEYKTGVTAEWGDELVSLSTCNHYTEDGRLVIVAKRIK